jgi:hypothetical protein
MGTIITIALAAGIGWWVMRIISRQAKDIKAGKCTGCSKDCSTCSLPVDFTE